MKIEPLALILLLNRNGISVKLSPAQAKAKIYQVGISMLPIRLVKSNSQSSRHVMSILVKRIHSFKHVPRLCVYN
jgi:hypothetical protein